MLQMLFIFGYSALIHLGLRLFGIGSKYMETLIIYTMLVGTFSPIITLLGYPAIIKMLVILQSIKAGGLDIFGAIKFFSSALQPKPSDSFVDVATIIVSQLAGPIGVIVFVVMSYEIKDWYKCAKSQVFTAIGFSIGVLGLPAAISYSILYGYVMYIFVGGEHLPAP
jgi:hypothetical protein